MVERGSLAGTAPTTAITLTNVPVNGAARIRGVDLSNATTNLVNVAAGPGVLSIENCKLASGVAVVTGTNPGIWGARGPP